MAGRVSVENGLDCVGGLKAAANMTPAQRKARARKAGLAGATARAKKAKAR